MLIGQPFALAAGVAVVWTRLFYAGRIARRFKAAKAAGVLRVRHRFRDAHEVEICARYWPIPQPPIPSPQSPALNPQPPTPKVSSISCSFMLITALKSSC